jgi:hypothetical protein
MVVFKLFWTAVNGSLITLAIINAPGGVHSGCFWHEQLINICSLIVNL